MENQKLDLMESIAAASKDLATVLSGAKASVQDEFIDKVVACESAGITVSGYARAECVRAQAD
eukprot:9345080-Pyramimonas_sp.AAC.1